MCGFSVYTGGDKMLRLSVVSEFQKIKYRGPDNSVAVDLGEKGWMGFHRLKIIDTSDEGNQPLIHKAIHLVANGEVYNYQALMDEYKDKYEFQSASDCEVIIPMFMELGIEETARRLDAEFVCVLYDADVDKYYAARDPVGIRPMFYGYASDGKIMFASEMKALSELCEEVKPFPPGYVYDGDKFICYTDIAAVEQFVDHEIEEVYQHINDLLTKGVEKRLHADVPVGFLLSGGLDSSLVCAIGQRMMDKPIRTFAVGIDKDPIDTKYARIVADYLGADHTEVLFTKQDIFDTLSRLSITLKPMISPPSGLPWECTW